MNKSLSAYARPLSALTIALALVAGAAVANDTPRTGEAKAASTSDSAKPVTDSWITTKVKADLLVTEEVKGLDINVSTVNGVVTLAGKLDTQAQIDKAVAVARSIKGVKSVDAKTLTTK